MISLMPTSIIYALLAGDGRELTAFPGWQHPCKEPFAGSRTTPYPPLTWFTATETFAVNKWFVQLTIGVLHVNSQDHKGRDTDPVMSPCLTKGGTDIPTPTYAHFR